MKMNEELDQLLKNLKLRRILDIYEEQLRAAEKEDVSYTEFALRLLRAQWHHRQESALEYRIRRANLPERWSLETFPYAGSLASIASRSAPSPNWSSSPRLRTSSSSDPPASENPDWLLGFCSKLWKTATVASSFALRTCLTKCTLRSPTVPRVSSSNALPAWTFC